MDMKNEKKCVLIEDFWWHSEFCHVVTALNFTQVAHEVGECKSLHCLALFSILKEIVVSSIEYCTIYWSVVMPMKGLV